MTGALAASFVVQVIQELVLALGVALAGANALALVRSRRARRRWQEDVEAANAERRVKAKQRALPAEPPVVAPGPALVNVAVGVLIALLALASLTFHWVG